VRNRGTARAGASILRVYLTRDAAASLTARAHSTTTPRTSVTDLRLTGTAAVPALGAGTRRTVAATFTIPAGTAAGTYALLACADDLGRVAEAAEAGNCVATAARVVVTAAAASASLRLQQFADTTSWPQDEGSALSFMRAMCRATYPAKRLTLAAAEKSARGVLTAQAAPGALGLVDRSGLARTAADAEKLAATAVTQGSPGLALAALLRAHDLEPRSGDHLANAAALAVELGLPNEALAFLDAAAPLDVHAPMGLSATALQLVTRGNALLMTGRAAAAKPLFSAARQDEPMLSEADAGLANVEVCAGHDAVAARYVRAGRVRTQQPRQPTEDASAGAPLPAAPAPALDLSHGRVTHVRVLPLPETPTQGADLRPYYQDLSSRLLGELTAESQRATALDVALRGRADGLTAAENARRTGIMTWAYASSDEPRAKAALARIDHLMDELVSLREKFWGGGTGEVKSTYEVLSDQADAACQGSLDYRTCVHDRLNATCRPALVSAHGQWGTLMAEMQHAEDDWLVASSGHISAFAANLSDRDAYQRLMVQISQLETAAYSGLDDEAQSWTHYEDLFRDDCVDPSVEVPTTPASPDPAAPQGDGACPPLLRGISFSAKLGGANLSASCEKVTVKVSEEVMPLLTAFADVTYNVRAGNVTLFAGVKGGGSVGPLSGDFKSGIYATSSLDGTVGDIGWRVGPSASVTGGPSWSDSMDISFVSGLRSAF
jgi:hypothetical protein